MKKLLFAIIAGLLFSCTNPTEPTANTPVIPPNNPNGKITTLIFSYSMSGGTGYTVLHTKAVPDTIIPVWENKKVQYRVADSIYSFTSINGKWWVTVANGNYKQMYSSMGGHTFIKLWRR